MKTKSFLILFIVFSIPTFLGLMCDGFIAVEWLVGFDPTNSILLSGKANYPLIVICNSCGIVFMAMLGTFFLTMWKNATKIDELDEATAEYYKSKRKYDEKISELSTKFLKS